ncbi:hypothetical protein F0562_004157 [Nyssa sinensis]|uniref:HTH myb-type domain-containing protein n=1 Tax=Nyssa sinensis TaxID=561372 RepID=A0A5J5BXS6_9ASTE|nr:hypothetical protein F0562_004157 [Nyssa sinensis]
MVSMDRLALDRELERSCLRWSLIAGRLPRRTANDVKNYWNTRLQKKTVARGEEVKTEAQKTMETKIIKPRPRTFSKNLTWLRGNNFMVDNTQPGDSLCTKPTPTSPLEIDGIPWWDDLFVDKEINNGITSWSITGLEEQPLTGLWSTEEATVPGNIAGDCSSVDQEVQNGWCDFTIDVDLWDLLSNEQEIML